MRVFKVSSCWLWEQLCQLSLPQAETSYCYHSVASCDLKYHLHKTGRHLWADREQFLSGVSQVLSLWVPVSWCKLIKARPTHHQGNVRGSACKSGQGVNDGEKGGQPGFHVGSGVNTSNAANKKETNNVHVGEALVSNVWGLKRANKLAMASEKGEQGSQKAAKGQPSIHPILEWEILWTLAYWLRQ